MARASNEPQQLLVEGQNDQHVLWNLCAQHRLPETFKVEIPGSTGGIEELIRDIPTRLQQRTLQTLGVVVDADRDPSRQWERLRGALASTTAVLPSAPASNGWVTDAAGPVGPLRLGIWVMPDNTIPGILEDFVVTLIPDTDNLLPRARAVLAELEAAGIHRYSITNRSKALVHTWLAWQEVPGNRMGTAIGTGHLRYDALPARAFIAWLRRLFDPTPTPTAV